MNIIQASVEKYTQGPGIEGIFKQVERCGRVCYKSEKNIKEGSAEAFTKRLINSGHGAMLEHGAVYLRIPVEHDKEYSEQLSKIIGSKYSIVHMSAMAYYVSTNLRVLVETGEHWEAILNAYLVDLDLYHEEKFTAHFIISRGIANEFVRHRVFSFAQESTRWVNYKEGLEVILPQWADPEDEVLKDEFDIWAKAMQDAELAYKGLKGSLKAGDARGVLPLDLKTELVMTGTKDQWEEFFKLRLAKDAHPDARYIANKWREMLWVK